MDKSIFLEKTADQLLQLPRIFKRALVLSVDVFLCIFTVWLAFCLSLNEIVYFDLFGDWFVGQGWATIVAVTFSVPIFIISGLYRSLFRYMGWSSLKIIIRAMSIYGLFYFLLFTVKGRPHVPRSVGIFQPILLALSIGGVRWIVQLWLGNQYRTILQSISQSKVLVYGAGRAGRQLLAAVAGSHEVKVVGFLDDNVDLQGRFLNNFPIYDPKEVASLVKKLNVDSVLLAMPKVPARRRSQILNDLRRAHIEVRSIPNFAEIAQGRALISYVQDLNLDDLLGRDPVAPDAYLLAKNITNQVVLVTGAGGSIGSELCRQIIALNPQKLLLVELNEFALYSIQDELMAALSGRPIGLIPLLGSVQDVSRMREIMSTWRPNTVYHAAAYKHVPLVEHNPVEGIRNNVWGTLCLAQLAVAYGVSNFVLISTDKAVRPTNVMGASKRLAEMVLQAFAHTQKSIRFSMVRFGNVLGSSGSVIPKFRQQIREGGPVTLTHEDITRYFMTIPEAAQLVIQAAAMAKGGDVFVLDMGQPVKIIDLARRMIELSGLSVRDKHHPDGDISIEITGLRPGEKLYEELLIGNKPIGTSHERIFKANEEFLEWSELEKHLQRLEAAMLENDINQIRLILHELVSGYQASESIVDWIYLESHNQANH